MIFKQYLVKFGALAWILETVLDVLTFILLQFEFPMMRLSLYNKQYFLKVGIAVFINVYLGTAISELLFGLILIIDLSYDRQFYGLKSNFWSLREIKKSEIYLWCFFFEQYSMHPSDSKN